MTALYIIFGIIAFIIILLMCPIRIKLVYDDKLKLRIGYLFLNFNVLPQNKDNKSDDTESVKSKNNPEHEENEKKSSDSSENKSRDDNGKVEKNDSKQKKNPILEFKDKYGFGGIFDLVKKLLDILTDIPKKLAKHLVIKMLDVKLLVVGEDSADTAIKYGYACSVIYPAVSLLENNLKIKKHNEEIVAGFLAESTAAEFTLYACNGYCKNDVIGL